MLLELESDTLSNIISKNDKVYVQFSAGWCGNCKIMKPKFKKMASENESATWVIIDAELNPESRKLANVDNLPTFAAFKGGQLIGQVQTNKADVLASFIESHN